MILFHFTAIEYIEDIKKEGLNRGDVPTSMYDGRNGVWLTSDPEPSGHGLSEREELTDEDRNSLWRCTGSLPPKGSSFFPNKLAVRITVVVPTTDRKLVRWRKWSRKHCEPKTYDLLTKANGHKHDTWWIYFGLIEPSRFRAIEYLSQGTPGFDGKALSAPDRIVRAGTWGRWKTGSR